MMNKIKSLPIIFSLIFATLAFADTLPPAQVKSKTLDGSGTPITSTNVSGKQGLDVNVITTSGAATVNQGNAGVQSWLAAITASVLPTNAAQETGGHLASIDSKLTSPLAVTGTFFQATQPVSGTFWQTTQPVSGTFWQSVQPISGSVSVSNFPSTQAVTGTFWQATQPVSGSLGRSWTLNSGTDSVTVSGSISATNPSVSATGSAAPAQATYVGSKDSSGNLTPFKLSTGGVLSVDGSAVTQPISGSVSISNFPATQAVTQSGTWNINNISGTITLPTGAASSGLQTSGNTTLSSILTALGSPFQSGGSIANTSFGSTQATAANLNATVVGPAGVALAKDSSLTAINTTLGTPFQAGGSIGNTSFGSTQSGTWNINNISGTISLPTGAANAGNQATANTSLASIVTNTTGSATAGNQSSQITQETTTATNTTSILANQTNGSLKTQVISNPVDGAPATQSITAQDVSSTTTPMANAQNFITGTPTAGSVASFSVSSAQALEVQVTGSWTGTMQSEISLDGGTTWFTRGVKQAGASYIASTFTANFSGGLNITGMTNYRIRSTAAMVGSATVRIVTSTNSSSITVTSPLTLRDSTVQSVADSIKAASTAAIATDTALVVAVSPNNIPVLPANAAQQSGINPNLDTKGSGTISNSGGSVTMTTNGASTCTAVITGTWSAALIAVGSSNGSTTAALDGFTTIGANVGVFFSSNNTYVYPAGGYGSIVIEPFSFTSGTATVNWECSSAPSQTYAQISTAPGSSSVPIGSVSLGQSTGKAIKGESGQLASSAFTAGQTVMTYTVTSGKTFYLEEADCSVMLNTAAATQTQFGTCQLLINGVQYWLSNYKGPGSGSNAQVLTYPEPIPIASGTVITWQATPAAVTAFLWSANIGGYEK